MNRRAFTGFLAAVLFFVAVTPRPAWAQEEGRPTSDDASGYADREAGAPCLAQFGGAQAEGATLSPAGVVLIVVVVVVVVVLVVVVAVVASEDSNRSVAQPETAPPPADVVAATCALCWGACTWTGVKCPGCSGTGKWGAR